MRIAATLIFVLAAYLLIWPVEIEPAAWRPLAAPEESGPYAANNALLVAKVHAPAAGKGGEAVALDQQGRVYTGFEDGRIVRLSPQTDAVEELIDTGGRPLGMKFAPDGRLIIADALQGLLAWDGEAIEVLLTKVDGIPLRFADDLDITRGGVVYLSDASTKYGIDQVLADVFEHQAHGRLIRYDLASGRAETVLDGLWFANGVALAADESFVLINETTRYQIRRLWLSGPRRGQNDVFIENLPGLPDNITRSPKGYFWVALYGPRSASLDRLLPQPFLRKVVWRLPHSLQPMPAHEARVVELNGEGEPLRSLDGVGEKVFAPITSVLEHKDQLWLGSLTAAGIASFDL